MVKKILMTADTVGGVWTYAMELCRCLRSHGIEVALATMGQPLSATQQQETRALQNVQIFESAFRLEWMQDSENDLEASAEFLCAVIDDVRPDLLHFNRSPGAHGRPCSEPRRVVRGTRTTRRLVR